MSNAITQRLQSVRAILAQHGLQACLVPTADPHLSEYLPDYWQARVWLSGFDGSAGTLLITADFAGLWTDSRYWVQAEQQLHGTGISLMRMGHDGVPKITEWLFANLPANAKIAVDDAVLDLFTYQSWSKTLAKSNLSFDFAVNPVALAWQDRPGLPAAPVYEHKPPFACRSRAQNLAAIRDAMAEHQADFHLISSLDDIAWIFNLRGADVAYNPVFLAHALISADQAILYTDQTKLDGQLLSLLDSDNIQLKAYNDIHKDLAALPASATLLVDPHRVTVGTLAGTDHVHLVTALNPSQLLKSIKNTAELNNIRETMRQDGAALCEFLAWLDKTYVNDKTITEIDVDTHLTAARARRPNFVSLSFPTIAGFNANGAMPHYLATPGSNTRIEGNGLLLIDSGGQYLGGTTDITRVIPIGTPTHAQCVDYTLVLKSHINLAMAQFPVATPGFELDTLARMPLWQHGLDYGHGTGHGVGYFLNVHEGPQSISVRGYTRPQQEFYAGMLTSNEPGLYRAGKWGIRIESLVVAMPAANTEFGDFLKFETVTLCPIATSCIVLDMLDANEIKWLNDYHAMVRAQLANLLEGEALNWLMENTQAL